MCKIACYVLCLSLIILIVTGCTVPAGNFLANGYVSGVISGGGGPGEVATAAGLNLIAQIFTAILGAI